MAWSVAAWARDAQAVEWMVPAMPPLWAAVAAVAAALQRSSGVAGVAVVISVVAGGGWAALEAEAEVVALGAAKVGTAWAAAGAVWAAVVAGSL